MAHSMRLLAGLLFTVVLIGFVPSMAQPGAKTFPFDAEEDEDGARYVWWIYGQADIRYMYFPAKFFPDSGTFRHVSDGIPQEGDVAWWKEFVALYTGNNSPDGINLMTASGKTSLKKLQDKYGQVKWYRFFGSISPLEPPSEKMITVDKILTKFDQVLGRFPPAVKNKYELDLIQSSWEQSEKELIAISQEYPRSAEVEQKLGEFYRFGHNMDVINAWVKSETHYKKALELSPWSTSSYLGLGILYVNTDFSYAAKAEPLFNEAIKVSYGQKIPAAAFSGLVFSYYYQGRMAEAVIAADHYLEMCPNDEEIVKIRNVAKSNTERDKKKNRRK